MAVIKVVNIDQIGKELGVKFPKHLREVVIYTVYETFLKSVEKFSAISPVDTGLYASAWSVRKENHSANDESSVSFGNTAPYAYNLEKGSGPFSAPIEPLLEWAARKLQGNKEDTNVKNLAWGVWHKFKKEGQKPLNILEKGIDDILIPEMKEALDKL